jgi:hypothetical protein
VFQRELDANYSDLQYCRNRDYNHFCYERKVKGDERLSCRMLIINKGKKKLPAFTVKTGKDELKAKALKDGNLEYAVQGNQQVKINW